MKVLSSIIIIAFVILSLMFWSFFRSFNDFSSNEDVVVNLAGNWKFALGDKPEYGDPELNDKDWVKIRVPGRWENQGFKDYDGFAWYRTTFKLKTNHLENNLYVSLGYIDDVDEVFLNGVSIAQTGNFPPYYETAHDQKRTYKLPRHLLKEINNLLAIRVFDQYGEGGIIRGNIEIFKSDVYEPEIQLSTKWKFTTGDDILWSRKDFDDSDWSMIKVPANWESQGYEDYDGYGWYRTSFTLTDEAARQKWVLMLGKIDDINEVYLNGRLLGNHGDFNALAEDNAQRQSHFYNVFRGYYIPQGFLSEGQNVIAVRVYDFRMQGGIYAGPIGLTTQDMYTQKWMGKKNKFSMF